MYTYKTNCNRPVHIVEERSGLTYCLVENNGKGGGRLNASSDGIPDGRRVCQVCSNLAAKSATPKKEKHARPNSLVGNDFYQSWEWARLRYEVLKTYGRRCMCCGIHADDGATICVDHIKPRKRHPDLELEFSNMQVLCSLCNRGKGSDDTTDWRQTKAINQSLPEDQIAHLRDIINS